jgi:hypothetical protein
MAGLHADIDGFQWLITCLDMTQTVVIPTVGCVGSSGITIAVSPTSGFRRSARLSAA